MGKVTITLGPRADLAGFRTALRGLLAQGIAPENVVWQTEATPSLFGAAELQPGAPVSLPRAVAALIELVVCHRDRERYGLLYALAWRITHGERDLLEVPSDPLVHRLDMLAKSVRRDLHKMHAFLRFRAVTDERGERFIAWFEPEHHILEATADFFIARFRALDWTILTPDGSLHWDRIRLTVGPPGQRSDTPTSDAFEAGWNGYYESTFNPARVNVAAMRQHMPKKYWHNMPETQAIPGMLRSAGSRTQDMLDKGAAAPSKHQPKKALPAMLDAEVKTLRQLNTIIAAAEPLVPGATRAVLGEGPLHSAIAFVGEQPGDQEDIEGHPFVGPAGQLLTRAMDDAGIERAKSYLTNAVKHFKYEQRGKRRIHQKPTTGEVKHYRWWLLKELELVRPKLVVALGGTAALALAGKQLSVTNVRGPYEFGEFPGFVTVHPSYLLRIPDAAAKKEAYRAFVADLRAARKLAA
jgi:DNA polymerase